MELALPKKMYKISLSGNNTIVVLLDQDPNWVEIIEKKRVVLLDWVTINGSYIMLVQTIEERDEQDWTAIARAKAQPQWIRQVAMHRVITYEKNMWKMTKEQIIKRINAFIQDMESYPTYHKIYNDSCNT